MIDPNKIKIKSIKQGDTIYVRAEVLEVLKDGWVYVRFSLPNAPSVDMHVQINSISGIESRGRML